MNFSKIICQNSVDAEWSEKKLKLGFQKPIFFFSRQGIFFQIFLIQMKGLKMKFKIITKN